MTKSEIFKQAHATARTIIELSFRKGLVYAEIFRDALKNLYKSIKDEAERVLLLSTESGRIIDFQRRYARHSCTD